jgi:hypothetical protein
MDVNGLRNTLSQAAQAGLAAQSDGSLTTGPTIDPTQAPAISNAVTVDVYHGSDGSSSTTPIGQTGVATYVNVAKVTDMDALTKQWFALSFQGLGDPSGALRYDYQTALSKLSPALQQKDWGFSVSQGQLVFTQGKDKLSAQDLTDLRNAFAGTGAAAAAQHVANATISLVSVARQMMPSHSGSLGSYDVTADNFSKVVDLRAYLMSHGPDGPYGQDRINKSDYSDLYQLTGVDAMFDQISVKAPVYSGK